MKHRHTTATASLILPFLVLLVATADVTAAGWKLNVTDKAPPAQIDPSIAALLKPQALQVVAGDRVLCEFWLRTELPLSYKPESDEDALKAIKEITLLGAAVIHSPELRDYKDNEIIPGAYTLRYGAQPVDGDHLGSSLYPYFALLLPAKVDNKPDAISRSKQMSKASGNPTATGHPVVLSLRPAARQKDLPALTQPEDDHKAIHLAVMAKPSDEPAQLVAFELVVEGHGEIQ